MQHPARFIWESASRPLFVRSVWLDKSGNLGHSRLRHFILDYEPHERQRWLQCPQQNVKRCGIGHQSEFFEINEKSLVTGNAMDYTFNEYLLLDATKLTLQRQQHFVHPIVGSKTQTAFGSANSRRSRKRRTWLLSNGKGYQVDLTDHHLPSHSRRSSLQDILGTSSHTANPEERLAERVINWLDLAGRADIVKAATPVSVSRSNAILPRNQRIGRNGHHGISLKRCPVGTQREAPRKSVTRQRTMNYCSNVSNAKPITIIFNREGVPVRFNRPARNIDLCTLSNSVSSARRLAGQLASARLYSGATTANTLEDTRAQSYNSRGMPPAQQDSRKQLHIFMPSLPKKGLILTAATNEDILSASLSDLYF